MNIWKLKQNAISISHSFISTSSLLKSFQQKPFSKFLPGDYLLTLCFVRLSLSRVWCNLQWTWDASPRLCLFSKFQHWHKYGHIPNAPQSKEKLNQNTYKTTNIVSSFIFHHFSNSCDYLAGKFLHFNVLKYE